MLYFPHGKDRCSQIEERSQQAIRNQVIRRETGQKNKDVAEFLGISPQHTSTLWQKYRKEEERRLPWKEEDVATGAENLTEEQERRIQKLIVTDP